MTTLVLSHLDYCNAVLSDLPDDQISRLQVVQNNAARLVFRESKRSHVTPLLFQLHWLPVKFRIKYKIATLAYRKFDETLPGHLSSLLRIKGVNPDGKSKDASARPTRSSLERLLVPPPIPRTETYGERAFQSQAPRVWNNLPKPLRDAPSLVSFKAHLKTHFFRLAYPDY